MTAEQAVVRFLQTQQQLQDQYREQSADFYNELLDAPLEQFYNDLLAAGLEPGDYEWAQAAHQCQLSEFMGNGQSAEYIPEQRARARHQRWMGTPQGVAAVLKYPDLADFAPDFDPNENYLDPNSDYVQKRSYWDSLTPAKRTSVKLTQMLDAIRAKQ